MEEPKEFDRRILPPILTSNFPHPTSQFAARFHFSRYASFCKITAGTVRLSVFLPEEGFAQKISVFNAIAPHPAARMTFYRTCGPRGITLLTAHTQKRVLFSFRL